MQALKVNVNDIVRVKLTTRGKEIYAKWLDEDAKEMSKWGVDLKTYNPHPELEDGWSEWQMWELMRMFGEHLYNGCQVPFETEIFITGEEA